MKIKVFLTVVMCTILGTAYAQSSNGIITQITPSKDKSYTSFYAQYNFNTYSVTDGSQSESMSGWDGVSVGWNMGKKLPAVLPLYLEYGLAYQYLSKSEKEDGTKVSLNIGTAKIPINLAYRFAVPDSKVIIAPYAGLNVKYHIWGKAKMSQGSISVSESIFDDSDAHRFQVGYQLGMNLDFGKAYIGISYGKDISAFESLDYGGQDLKTLFSTTSITIGYNF